MLIYIYKTDISYNPKEPNLKAKIVVFLDVVPYGLVEVWHVSQHLHHIPRDCNLYSPCYQNLKPHNLKTF
jgi:hypothetical protein